MKLSSLRGKDLKEVFKKGRQIRGRYLRILYIEGKGGLRLAVVVKKKIGKAVVRNKLRRQVREIFRKEFPTENESFDIIILLNEGSAEADFVSLKEDILSCLERMRS